MTVRALKPKPPVVVSSAFVSQLTCVAVLAIDERRYLEQLVPLCTGQVTRLGKLRLVPLDVAVAKLRELASSTSCPANDDAEDAESRPATADDVLARLGLRRTGASR